MKDFTNQFLDDMTNKERSIFLYHFVLGNSQVQTAKRLKLSLNFVNTTCKTLKQAQGFIELKERILESFMMDEKPTIKQIRR